MKLDEVHRRLRQLDKLERQFYHHQNDQYDLPTVPDIASARKNELWVKWNARNEKLIHALKTLREMEV